MISHPLPSEPDLAALREALTTALSVALHEEADPDCTGNPPYDATAYQAEQLIEAMWRAPAVRAALAAANPTAPALDVERPYCHCADFDPDETGLCRCCSHDASFHSQVSDDGATICDATPAALSPAPTTEDEPHE